MVRTTIWLTVDITIFVIHLNPVAFPLYQDFLVSSILEGRLAWIIVLIRTRELTTVQRVSQYTALAMPIVGQRAHRAEPRLKIRRWCLYTVTTIRESRQKPP